MNTRFKLTSQELTTHKGFKLPDLGTWFYPADVTSEPKPCSNTVLHHYADPLLAVLFNPIHANIQNPRLFEIEIDEEIGTDGLKGWCRGQRLGRELELPVLSTEQRVAFAIYCAEPYGDAAWQTWATNWKNGTDRTADAAASAARHAADAASYAADAAAYHAAAYHAAAYHAAAYHAAQYAAQYAARAAAYHAAQYAAQYAARAAAARAAAARAAGAVKPDFLSIINRIIKENVNEITP